MNLSKYPRLSELSKLTQQVKKEQNYYDIVVEHDGSVRLEITQELSGTNEFRFCFKQCLLKSKYPNKDAIKNLKFLNQLYKNLLYCWEFNMTGVIDPDDITGIINLQHRQEANQKWENENLNTMFMLTGSERRYAHV